MSSAKDTGKDIWANIKMVWQRVLFALLYLMVAGLILDFLFGLLVVLQCGFMLITGRKNDNLAQFTAVVLRYYLQVLNYLAFRSDELPFPFSNFPSK